MLGSPDTSYYTVDHKTLAQARRLMRTGLDLHEAAHACHVRSRDLDHALWGYIGELAAFANPAPPPEPPPQVVRPPRAPRNADRDAKVYDLYLQGVHPALVAERYGLSTKTVVDIIKAQFRTGAAKR